MAVQQRLIDYQHGDLTLQAEMFWDDSLGQRPAVLVAATWVGRTEFEGSRARELAELGYVGIAIDMYGKGIVGDGPEQCSALMTPIVSDRILLQGRMAAAVDAARAQPEVLSQPVAAIGFCLGGLCVLDLARSKSDIAAVVSFHGLLMAPDNLKHPKIAAKVLVLHGYDDPMATPEAMIAFANEMTSSGVDWQVHAYGGTSHAFTNPNAADPSGGMMYNPVVASRAFAAMRAFLKEVLGS